jgi:hypothetical protein
VPAITVWRGRGIFIVFLVGEDTMANRHPFLVFALCAGLAAARPATANSNKLVNPFFTGGLDGWTLVPDASYTISYSPWVGHAAPGSMVVIASGVEPIHHVIAHQVVNVSAGATYSIGTYFWYPADVATTPYADVGIAWFTGLDGSGSLIANDPTPPTPAGPAGSWLLAQKTVIAPPLAKSALILPGFTTYESKTSLGVFDDVFVYGGVNGGVIGDVNGDGAIGVADVFYLINYLFANGSLPVGPSDVNNDYTVDVSDVFYLVNYLFAGGGAPLE